MDAVTVCRRRWRWLVWGGVAMLLAMPAVAMRFTAEVRWTAADFAVMGMLLGGLALAFEFLLRRSGAFAYQFGAAVALGTTFLLIWVNLAVGILGTTGNPANLLFALVIATAAGGAILARFAAGGMARAMAAAALVEAAILPILLSGAVTVGEGPAWVQAVSVLTVVLVVLWLSAAWLFRQAARGG